LKINIALKIITNTSGVKRSEWSRFVVNHPEGNIFQTPEMFDIFQNTLDYTPITLFAVDDNIIVGLLVGAIRNEKNILMKYISSRCIIWGGPLIKEDKLFVADELMKYLVIMTKNNTIYIEFRNLYDIRKYNDIFAKYGFEYKAHLNIIINLDVKFDYLKKKMHSSRIKNYNKALKKGITVKELNREDEIIYGYNLVSNTYKRKKIPGPSLSLFLAVSRVLRKNKLCYCYAVYYLNKMIGFRMVLAYKHMFYDYYAGSDHKESNKYPNDVLIIELLKKGCDMGSVRFFDFGGAGKPNEEYGVRDHKLKFGGDVVEYGRFLRINCKVVYNLGLFTLKIRKKLSFKQ